jgi:pilus assembly protein Flp/PilA
MGLAANARRFFFDAGVPKTSSSPRAGTEKRPVEKFGQALVNFLQAEDGPTAVEYAVMLALIIVVCITAITALGSNSNNTFSFVATQVGKTGS